MFIPLHTKSDYSLGYGTAAPEEVAERAAQLGYKAAALTDIESLAGQLRFHSRCKSLGVKAITGVELRPPADRTGSCGKKGRVIVIARDGRGYESLCCIINSWKRSPRDSALRGNITVIVDVIASYPHGIIVLSDDAAVMEDVIGAAGIDKEYAGLLVVRPSEAESSAQSDGVMAAAKRLKIKTVADLDVVFMKQDDHLLHLLQRAISLQRNIGLLSAPDVEDSRRFMRPPDEASALFKNMPEAVAASEEFAAACSFDLTGLRLAPPSLGLPSAEAVDNRLIERCGRAVKYRMADGAWGPIHAERLEEELSTVTALGFSAYLLILAAITDFCRENSIPVAARGSAVSSLVVHILGASCVDPLTEGLFFERFLHAGKTSWPDVDLDLPTDRRDEVIEWVCRNFGQGRVAAVSVHQRFQLRSALREGLTAFGCDVTAVADIMKTLPPDELQNGDFDLPAAFEELSLREPPRATEDVRRLLPLIQRLEGLTKRISAHPAGFVIGGGALDRIVPLERAAKGIVITQFDYSDIASLGLMKIDLLGNNALSEIADTLRMAAQPVNLDAVPPNDGETLSIIDNAQTVGCFQLESPAMRSLLSRIPIKNQDDVTTALALIRPGAAAGRAKQMFVRCVRSGRPPRLDPALYVIADRIAATGGQLLFEEDIMELLCRTAGISLAQADTLRSGIAESGGNPQRLSALLGSFLDEAAKNDEIIPARRRQLAKVWQAATRFAAYSFNKAHAASYGRLAYISAFMKAHHPVEFTCALIKHHQALYPLRTIAAEMIRRGVVIKPAHVNSANYETGLDYDASVEGARCVRLGLERIKGLSRRASLRIMAARKAGPFVSLPDFKARVGISLRELKSLILAGACDDLEPLGASDYPFIHEAVIERLASGVDASDLAGLRVEYPEAGRRDLYQTLSRALNELRYTGMHLSAHPLALLRSEAAGQGCLPIAEARKKADAKVGIVGLASAMRRFRTAEGILQFVTFEDESGLLETVVPPDRYAILGDRITAPGPFKVEGRLLIEDGAATLRVSSIEHFRWIFKDP